jgi:hypothetical protein
MKFEMIMCDLDGVLADFDGGIKKLTGLLPHQLGKRDMWKAVAHDKTFFEKLDLLPDAMELYQFLKSTGVPITVLTGLPTMNNGADQKRRWVARVLGEDQNVIVLPSKEKYMHATNTCILIDDRPDTIGSWCDAGGKGILHKSTETTIAQLKAVGF